MFDDSHFEADLGIRENQRPILSLQGTYNYRGRIIVVKGISSNRDSRFYGLFRGNFFIIQTQIRERRQTIFGQCRFDENHEIFSGAWTSRIFQGRGWITGSFN